MRGQDLPVGTIVRVRTENGGQAGGVLLGNPYHLPQRSYVRTLGECGAECPGRVRLDTGAALIMIEGWRITELVAA